MRRARGRDECRRGGESAEPGLHAASIVGPAGIGALAVLAILGCAGAAPREHLAAAAVAARGGPLLRFERSSDLDVHAGFPGAWQWEIGFEAPERVRITIETASETQTLASDGTWLRTYLGTALVSQEPARGSSVGGLLTFVELSTLDVLLDRERVRTDPLHGSAPAGIAHALRVQRLDGSGAELALGFDAELRLVWLAGPASVPGLGEGRLEARFDDFRRVGRYLLPFAVHYRFRDAPLLDERVRAWRIGDLP
jgi:hypothetical protein